MKTTRLFWNLLIAGMSLGTAWAIRGQFGHEQGAAWAGAIGGIAIILLARRPDWNARNFRAALAAAIGWGLGGMMSYGQVVGYGRGSDFINVFYGFLMLFVIGGLYGYLGGGLFGLTLADHKNNKIKWPLLLTGMTSGGIITYFFLIMQWEWLMTPPRSEVWAVCLGMGLFMTWFLVHFKQQAALRVAAFSGLGGGFGFAFGNFLQVMGTLTAIHFNFWNVMEYTLGFFGGIGMAYGTFTSSWEAHTDAPKKQTNWLPMLLAVLFIPMVVWDQSFGTERLQKTYEKLLSGGVESIAMWVQIAAMLLILLQTAFLFYRFHLKKQEITYSTGEVKTFFISHFAIYIIFSLLITGAIVSGYRIEQYLYILNFIIILAVMPRLSPDFSPKATNGVLWGRNVLIVLAILALLAIIAINMHDAMPGAQVRFKF